MDAPHQAEEAQRPQLPLPDHLLLKHPPAPCYSSTSRSQYSSTLQERVCISGPRLQHQMQPCEPRKSMNGPCGQSSLSLMHTTSSASHHQPHTPAKTTLRHFCEAMQGMAWVAAATFCACTLCLRTESAPNQNSTNQLPTKTSVVLNISLYVAHKRRADPGIHVSAEHAHGSTGCHSCDRNRRGAATAIKQAAAMAA